MLSTLAVFIYAALLIYGHESRSLPNPGILCTCEDPSNHTVRVFEVKLEMYKELVNNYSYGDLAHKICHFHVCVDGFPNVKMNRMSLKEENGMTTRGLRDNEVNGIFPIKFTITGSAGHHNRTRFRRFPKTCNDSLTSMPNRIITCWAWPEYLTCEFSCIHGYAFEEDGKVLQKVTRNCREMDNYWKPKEEFPICKPYIHCETFLVSPGYLKCEVAHDKPAYCDISCLPYDEHDEVPLKRYECLNKKYADVLPHCASVKKDEPLINPPRD